MSAGPADIDICAVCGRTILHGERVSAYVTTEGEPASVCDLCKERAEAAGWIPAHLAGDATVGRRRRGRRRWRIRERLAAYGERARTYGERARAALRSPRPETPAQKPAPAPERPADRAEEEARPKPVPKDPARAAIAVFNGSHERRKVAGLIRSLGSPQVSVHAGRGSRGAALITVAWELSWYQWEVGANDEGVREVGKGGDLSELPDPKPRWNASAGENGELALGAPGGSA